MAEIRLFNQDCMTAMKEMPDKAFDLAIVDPPYGGGCNAGVGGRFARYEDSGGGGRTGQQRIGRGLGASLTSIKLPPVRLAMGMRRSLAQRSSIGMLRQVQRILTNWRGYRRIKLFGEGIILTFRQQGVFWCGVN